MYIFKNALRNMLRNRGKNILIGVIITVTSICTCIGLAINKAGNNLVKSYKDSNPLAVSLNLDMSSLRGEDDSTKSSFESITVEDVIKYANSKLVKDYYYTLESSLSSSTIEAVVDNERPQSDNNENAKNMNPKMNKNLGDIGDFRISAYSNFAYLNDFSDGTKKITNGEMVSGSDTENEIVISEDLALKNEINVGDSITFSLPSDESITFEYKVKGIYENNKDDDSSNFMQINVLNSVNQIYANIKTVQEILDKVQDDNTKLVASNGLSVKYYLTENDNLESFEEEVRSKGLDNHYKVETNEEEILTTLKPIQNISQFSRNFLIVIIIIGVVVLAVINFLNIRDRKYEIGVLRAIGMSKSKVTIQFILEIFFVALISLAIGSGIGCILSQPVTNKMLENEINSYQNEVDNLKENFGKEGFEQPARNFNGSGNRMGRKNNVDQNITYVDTLKVEIDIMMILELFIVGIGITIVSSSIACLFINKYNPNRILQNRI